VLSHFNVTICQRFIEQYSNICHDDFLSGDSLAVQRCKMYGGTDKPDEANTDGPPYPQFTAA